MSSQRKIFTTFARPLLFCAALSLGTSLVANAEEHETHASGEHAKNAAPLPVPASAPSQILLTNALVTLHSTTTNAGPVLTPEQRLLVEYQERFDSAQKLRQGSAFTEAEPLLVTLLADPAPEQIKQAALLELALLAQDRKNLSRAQEIYGQFALKWPSASQLPEILLRQGQMYREMGLNGLALTKFYGVMTTALVVKNDGLDYYRRLVLLAQTEIAQTHFVAGKYTEAAEFFSRLLKQNNPALARAATQLRLIRCVSALGPARADETVSQSLDYLSHYPGTGEQPEVRLALSRGLLQLGRRNDALQQTLALLQEQSPTANTHPQNWAYWQQQGGNEIGNQFYRDGEYSAALDIYLALSKLDHKPAWQLPAMYQIGLVYEKLSQPEKALQSYQAILDRGSEPEATASPVLKEVLDMARWRSGFLQWHQKAERRTPPPT